MMNCAAGEENQRDGSWVSVALNKDDYSDVVGLYHSGELDGC